MEFNFVLSPIKLLHKKFYLRFKANNHSNKCAIVDQNAFDLPISYEESAKDVN